MDAGNAGAGVDAGEGRLLVEGRAVAVRALHPPDANDSECSMLGVGGLPAIRGAGGFLRLPAHWRAVRRTRGVPTHKTHIAQCPGPW